MAPYVNRQPAHPTHGHRPAGTLAPNPRPGSQEHGLPACPACGELQCLCRPRFFAGQLLTEEDLNRLDHYIVEKNKLRNRYLHGWGVVCGLEVVCHPCQDYVTVRSGYALSPCGEDIVICSDETVNVCALIQECRQIDRRYPDCESPRPGSSKDCQEVVEDWVLAICYDEKPSRGITALQGSSGSACCSRCSCGGSSSCGCGCHTNPDRNSKTEFRPLQRRTPPQCEPTVICEGYAFNVYKVLPGDRADEKQRDQGEMERRFAARRALFEKRWAKLPMGASKEQLHAWCCDTKAELLDFFAQHPTYDCRLYERLERITCPKPEKDEKTETLEAYKEKLASVVAQITSIGAEYERYCKCSALLPPCPEPVTSNCVPLATIKIRKADCQILQVCNWGPRRFVVTFPHLGYWLNISGMLQKVRNSIEKSCCTPFREKRPRIPLRPVGAFPINAIKSTAMSETSGSVFSTLFSQTWLNKTRTVDEQALLLAALGATDENDHPFATDLELANPLPFLLLNQVVRPTLETVLPVELSSLMETLASGGASGAPGSASAPPLSEEAINALRREMEDLQKTVREQGEEIRRLRREQ